MVHQNYLLLPNYNLIATIIAIATSASAEHHHTTLYLQNQLFLLFLVFWFEPRSCTLTQEGLAGLKLLHELPKCWNCRCELTDGINLYIHVWMGLWAEPT